MCSNRVVLGALGSPLLAALLSTGVIAHAPAQERLTAAGEPAEGELDAFCGEPFFEKQVLYNGGKFVRGPNIAVAVDGTVLARGAGRLRRSEDGGASWSDPQPVPAGALIVDENNGHILAIDIRRGERLSRSRDHGETWQEEETTLKPNDLMRWMERAGIRERATPDDSGTDTAKYYLHTGASETGITLRHGPRMGRLLNTATFRPHAQAHPSDRKPADAIYSCAIFSDDGGATWHVSGLFPESFTEEAALAELHDGRIYYNSRSHKGYHDRSLARELRPDETFRREAWSIDGGQTWEDLRVSPVLPDGGGYGRGYGLMGGLMRLPIVGRDVLLFSNTDTGGGERERMTVWASFDGGQTWPVKRLVNTGPSAYSSMAAGRPQTPSDGRIFLLFEGGEEGRYSAIQVARFNLSWVLKGEVTGNGELPKWLAL